MMRWLLAPALLLAIPLGLAQAEYLIIVGNVGLSKESADSARPGTPGFPGGGPPGFPGGGKAPPGFPGAGNRGGLGAIGGPPGLPGGGNPGGAPRLSGARAPRRLSGMGRVYS